MQFCSQGEFWTDTHAANASVFRCEVEPNSRSFAIDYTQTRDDQLFEAENASLLRPVDGKREIDEPIEIQIDRLSPF